MNAPFRVGIITAIFRPSLGGPATYLEHLLRRLEESSVDTLVLVPELSQVAPSPHVHFEFYRRRYHWKYVDLLISEWCLLRALRGVLGRVDVAYCHGADVALGLLFLLGRRKQQPRLVQKFTGYPPWENMIRLRGDMARTLEDFCALSFGALWRRYGLLLAMYDHIHRRALSAMDAVIVPGRYLAGVARLLGVKEERIRVIYNAVPRMHEWPAGETPLPAPSPKTLLVAGRLVAHKGIRELIGWVGGKDGWRLWIAGEGPEGTIINQELAGRGTANVILLGALSAGDLWRRTLRAHVFALNSLYEGFPHVLLECVWAGRPYVASRIPGNEEVHHLMEECGGYLFTPHIPEDFWRCVEMALRHPPQRLARAREILRTVLDDKRLLGGVLQVLRNDPPMTVKGAPA